MSPEIQHALQTLGNRLRLLFSRAAVSRIYEGATGKMQRLQLRILAGETADKVERAEPYGLSAHPLPGAEAFVVANGGSRSHLVALLVGDPRHHRPVDLAPGEVVVYSSAGNYAHLRADGTILVHSPAEIRVEADTNITLAATDTLRLEGDVVELAAATKLKRDVNGYGEDWVYDDGTGEYHVDTWKTGDVVAGADNAISPPEHGT